MTFTHEHWRIQFRRQYFTSRAAMQRTLDARPGRPPQVPPHGERLVVGQALAWPTWGCRRVSLQLARDLGVSVSPSTGQRLLRRAGLGRRRERLALLEHPSAGTCGLLTDRTRRQLARVRGARARHLQADVPGELVGLDPFDIGQRKGVGRIWQITACDAACSYGVAGLLPALSAEATAAFLRDVLAPLYQRAGWPLQRVLTDGGSEFKGAFAATCQALGIRPTRTQPRHAWTNGFVERLQGTILHEHWRIEFRRRSFTSRAALQRSLEAFMRFYNERRPHQGYRGQGRTPAELFWGVVPAAG